MGVPSGTQPSPGPFALAVSAEIRAILGRRQMSGAQLARLTNRSQGYVSKRLRGEASFTATDVEDISRVLKVDLLSLLTAAVRASRQ